ncbi:MAG: phage holin family protein [Flavobacteriaceae bacterium]
MNYILKILLSAIAVFVLANIVPGISIESYTTAILVAIVLGLLNTLVRPLLIFFTIPLTLITLGLFLLIINAIMVLLSDYFISGFNVSGLFSAILFSILLSLTQSVLYKLLDNTKKTH